MKKKQKKSVQKKKNTREKSILWFSDIGKGDIALVGGKNASLGEMYRFLKKSGVSVPHGFAITAKAYQQFLEENGLHKHIKQVVKDLDVTDIRKLRAAGKNVRTAITKASFSPALEKDIIRAYKKLGTQCKAKNVAVAVRSSATAEDLPDASFAGQQETYLQVVGEKAILTAVKKCMASLFTDRAISYRERNGFDHLHVKLSVTVQQMIDASKGASGVIFTMDTESGFQGVTLITSSYGLGEYVVKGRVIPDRFYVFKEGVRQGKNAIISRQIGTKDVKLVTTKDGTKQAKVSVKEKNSFSLGDKDLIQLAKWAEIIESHYKTPQDIEWVKDGKSGKLYIVQARPETVQTHVDRSVLKKYHLKKQGKMLLDGIAVGQRIGAGKVHIIDHPKDAPDFQQGEVLVTKITDPDWEPLMRKASAIITEQGGKTSHAAIVSRELGVPCIVGAKQARKVLKTGQKVTVSCVHGDTGKIFKGLLPFEVKETVLKHIPKTKTKIMMNVGDPENAFDLSFLPADGVGLARLEFIFSNFIRIHPLALMNYKSLKKKATKDKIAKLTKGYKNKADYCIDKLAEGIGRIAAAQYPKPVVVRTSDFKTNEYASLIGGKEFEPKEQNPMLGWRGASRYYSPEYKKAFGLECAAIKKVREEWGLDNVIVMIPFCRTPEEGQKVLDTMASFGLKRGENGLQVYVMCEIPSNVVLAEDFAQIFDGFSIGSNDLTQLTLGIDRDAAALADIGDANNKAIRQLIKDVINVAHKHKRKVGICGQAPSDSPEFAEFLVQQKIDSISLNPDTLIQTRQRISKVEKNIGKAGKKKTHKKTLSMVMAFGIMAASLLGIGSGCTTKTSQEHMVENNAPAHLSPAAIRKAAMKYAEGVIEQKEQDLDQALTPFYEEDFASFSFSYPAKWEVKHWNGGVSFFGEEDGQEAYMSVYRQIIAIPEAASSTSFTLDGKEVQKIVATLTDGREATTLIFEEEDEQPLVIEGSTKRFTELVETFSWTTTDEVQDRSLTHWDVRDRKTCTPMVTYARKGENGICEAFARPCDIPSSWEVCYTPDE